MGHTILFSEFQMGHTILFLTKKNSDKNTRGEHLKIKQNIPRLRSEDMGDFNVITTTSPIPKFTFRNREAKFQLKLLLQLQLKLYET